MTNIWSALFSHSLTFFFFFFCKIKCFTCKVYINLVQKSFPIITINWVVTNEMLIFIIKLRVKKEGYFSFYFSIWRRGIKLKVNVHECPLSVKARMCSTFWCCRQTANTDVFTWNTYLTSSSSVDFHDSVWQLNTFLKLKLFIIDQLDWFIGWYKPENFTKEVLITPEL